MKKEIIVAGGCFWGVQSAFDKVNGVLETEVGYTGGHLKNPTYKDVCSDKTGHVEAVKIAYDTKQISLAELLDIFFMIHDPTTISKQGVDIGSQYQSTLFYQNEIEKKEIVKSIQKNQKYFVKPIKTIVREKNTFYPAEQEHQKYLQKQGEKTSRCVEVNKETFLQQKLTPNQYWVMRGRGTEAPFSGEYLYNTEKGVYRCAACGQKLFLSDYKFSSECGWPAFDNALPETLIIKKDFSHFMIRDEVICRQCGSHLGHLFCDGPTKTGVRYCINSVALTFVPQKRK